ncbi:glyoxalase/bleomycin resistance/dioxygenase family protein [Streptomyces flaveolus]|uniref:glyoxalase/bleomycin resistance/dioxygenase family protein n=1 Tax=Streptomyces flaveolus TaxID=67297 RepID=UPI0033F5BA3E
MLSLERGCRIGSSSAPQAHRCLDQVALSGDCPGGVKGRCRAVVLIEGESGRDTRLDHLGVEVATTEQVTAATTRLKDASLATFEVNDTSRYALQDKTWVTGPGKEPWEVHVVKADADTLEKASTAPDACCGTTACCTTDEQAVDPTQTPTEAKAAAGCACGS